MDYLTLPLSGDLEYSPTIHFVSKTSISQPDTLGQGQGHETSIPGYSTTTHVMSLSGSNVGIRTTTPAANIHVNGNGLISTQLAIGHSSAVSSSLPNLRLQIGDGWTFSDMSYGKIMGYNCRFLEDGSCGRHLMNRNASAAVRLNPDGSIQLCTAPYTSGAINWNYLTMLDNGNVGIGLNPQCKLHVAGAIKAQMADIADSIRTKTIIANYLWVDKPSAGAWSHIATFNAYHPQAKALVVANRNDKQEVFVVYGNGVMSTKKIFTEKIEVTMNAMNSYW